MEERLNVSFVQEEATETKLEVNNRKELKYTDEDVDQLIRRKFAQWQKKQQKAVEEAARLSAIQAEQRVQEKCDRLERELNEYKQKHTITESAPVVQTVLPYSGISVSEELLSLLVTAANERLRDELPRKRRRRMVRRLMV